MPKVRVIGLGQQAAGDDGAGLAVIAALKRLRLPPEVECTSVAEASALVPLLFIPGRVVIVDALAAAPPGEVRELNRSEVDAAQRGAGGSSHGLGVAQAIELASAIEPALLSPDIRILGITIAPPRRLHEGLSPAVAAAVQRAVERILELLQRG